MIGVVFVQFVRMMETRYGLETTEKVFDVADLESGGAYTSYGDYSVKEFFTLAHTLAAIVKKDPNDIFFEYGESIQMHVMTEMPTYFDENDSALEFFKKLGKENIGKSGALPPDLELPRPEVHIVDDDNIEVIYYPREVYPPVACGVVHAIMRHYDIDAELDQVETEVGGEACVLFRIQRRQIKAA